MQGLYAQNFSRLQVHEPRDDYVFRVKRRLYLCDAQAVWWLAWLVPQCLPDASLADTWPTLLVGGLCAGTYAALSFTEK